MPVGLSDIFQIVIIKNMIFRCFSPLENNRNNLDRRAVVIKYKMCSANLSSCHNMVLATWQNGPHMEQFMQRSLCDRTKREQKRVPVRVQFSVFCVCMWTQRSQTVILKHKQHKDFYFIFIFDIYKKRLRCCKNYCDIIANIRYIAPPILFRF